jgi:hypothetical protein
VNESGAVAAQRWRYNADGTFAASSAWIWHHGEKLRLRPGRFRTLASVNSLNDFGVAVGSIARADAESGQARPVVWRNGEVSRLPIPRRAASAVASENNNHGLVIGEVYSRTGEGVPWYWRLGNGGSSGPLQSPGDGPLTLNDVDNRDRIVGYAFDRSVRGSWLWAGPRAEPQALAGSFPSPAAMNDHGDLTGTDEGFRGFGNRAFFAHVGWRRTSDLPLPPTDDPEGWNNTAGTAVIRGVTYYAPEGGVTVGGFAQTYEFETFPILWTCVGAT